MYYVHFTADGSSQWVHTMEHFEFAQEYGKRHPGIRYHRCFEIDTTSQATANAVGDSVAALIAHGTTPDARLLRSVARVREVEPFA